MPNAESARILWTELIKAYASQTERSHADAAKSAGCTTGHASNIYNYGLKRPELPPIKDLIGAQQAENRAIREVGATGDLRLVDAQEDARRVSFQEGQMIASTRLGVAVYVEEVRGIMEAVAPVMRRMQEDIRPLAEDADADGKPIAPHQRQAAVRDAVWLQRMGAKMVKAAMDLERKYNNEPTAIIGVELGADVNDLLRRALESAAILEHTAELIDVTPEVQH